MHVKVIPKADPVDRERVYIDSVFCEDKRQTVRISRDPRANPSHSGYYNSAVGHIITYLDGAGRPMEGYGGVMNAGDSTMSLPTPSRFQGGSIRVTPFTCDIVDRKTSPVSIHIRHYVEINSDIKYISLLKYIKQAGDPYWDRDDSLKACTYYSSWFNDRFENRAYFGDRETPEYGAGDGYVYLQAGDGVPSKVMKYTWEYDSRYLELATDKMATIVPFILDGFGENKYRIIFKVKNVSVEDPLLSVRAIATCQYCEDTNAQTYQYGFRTPIRYIEKEDSLLPYTNYALLEEGKRFCSEAEAEFTIVDKKAPSLTDQNGTQFVWTIPPEWQDLGPVVPGYKRRLKVGKISTFEDSAYILNYPQNMCYRNGSDINSIKTKIYLKKTPRAPVFYDGRGIPDGEIVANNSEDAPIGKNPDTYYMLCNGNSGLNEEKGLLVGGKDTITSCEITALPSFFVTGPPTADIMRVSKVPNSESEYNIYIKIHPKNNHAGREGEFGVRMENSCGLGKEAKFTVKVIDTLAVVDPIVDNKTLDEDYDTLPCEGSEFKPYISNEQYVNKDHPNYQLTDVCIVNWKIPDTWKYKVITDSHDVSPTLLVGSKAGYLEVSFQNKCGSSKFRKTLHKIDPLEYTRVSLQGPKNPCQAAEETYKFDTVSDTDVYIWKFPKDWICPNGQNIDTTYFADLSEKYTSMKVKVGYDSGYLEVRGFNYKCDTCIPSYPNPRIDSLKLSPKTYTKAPLPTQTWMDTVCARTEITLAVKAASVDSGSHMTYEWLYGSDWNLISSTAKGDTIKFEVPDKAVRKDSLRVISDRSDCPLNEGDTLRYVFVIMDTVPPKGAFLDGNKKGSLLGETPCEGDTVFCYLDPSLMDPSVEKMVWKWAGGNNIHGDDSLLIDHSGWRLVDTNKYRDTLALIVGRNKLEISVQAFNCCGLSQRLNHEFTPVNLIIDTAKFDDISDFEQVCTREILTLKNSVPEHAVSFEWHYKWGAKCDTTLSEGSRTFDIASYDTGFVFFKPYNQCGYGPSSEKVHIKQILNPPTYMEPVNFGGNYDLAVRDTVMDTLCLREKVHFHVSPSSKDTMPLTVSWTYVISNTDVLDVFNNQDTLCDVIKNDAVTNFIIVAGKHTKCSTYGDSLFIELRTLDTVAIPDGEIIENYISDLDGFVFSTKPCGMDTMKFSFNWNKIGQCIDSSWFQWYGGTEIRDSSLAGSEWKMLDSSLLSQTPQKMYVRAGVKDSLVLNVKTHNRCGYSQLPIILIEPTSIITANSKFKNPLSLKVCDNEEFILSVDSVVNAGSYVWHLPLGKTDTVKVSPKRKFSGSYVKGNIWVVPLNGCGPGPSTDTLVFDTILTPPARLKALNFGSPIVGSLDSIQDTICRNTEFVMVVEPNPVDVLPLYINWGILSNPADITLSPQPNRDTARIKNSSSSKDVWLYASARHNSCQTYGDSLFVSLFSMDTFSLAQDQSIADYIYDSKTTLPMDTAPCAYSTVSYYFDKTIRSFVDSYQFYWNGGQDLTIGARDWKILDATLLPDTLLMQVGNDSSLILEVETKNRCGISLLPSLKINPVREITKKPSINIISPNSWTNTWCYLDSVTLKVDTVEEATHYIWHYPWTNKADTTQITTHTIAATYDSGYIWVETYNSCGRGIISDSLKIDHVLKNPSVLPLNFALGQHPPFLSNTVTDTVCFHGETELTVGRKDINILEPLIYDWKQIQGGLTMTQQDSSILVKNPTSSNENVFKVAARWAICKNYGDTLTVKIFVVDTVAINLIGKIIPILPDTNNLTPCSGTTMAFGVEHPNAAPAYKWILPPTWTFVSGKDSTADTVYLKVGFSPGQIQLAPITDASMRICPYFSSSPIAGVRMTPPMAPVVNGWKQVDTTPCVGKKVTYKIKHSDGAKGFVWTFPKGWKANDKDTNVALMRDDSACYVLVGKDSGLISVQAWDSCGDGIMLGPSFSIQVNTIDTARVFVTGDLSICKDSTSVHYIQKNAYTDYFEFELIQPVGSNITHAFNADSTVLEVTWKDTLASLVFKPVNLRCGMAYNDSITIVADTIPVIMGDITGPDYVCAGAIHMYKAKATSLGAGISVGYLWELPMGWVALSALDCDSIWVKVDPTKLGGFTDTIKCFPSALCGTALPFEYLIKVNAPDSLHGKILIEDIFSGMIGDTTPCTGSTLKFTLTENSTMVDTIVFGWSMPNSPDNSWILQSTDSTEIANMYVGNQKGLVSVRARKKGGCGWTRPVSVEIAPSFIPPTTSFTRKAYPCIDDTGVAYLLTPSKFIDSVLWDFSSMGISIDFYNPKLSQSVFKYDMVHFDSVGSVPFDVKITMYNKCGTKDTSLQIIPTTNITPIIGSIEGSKICKSDTAYCFVDVPLDHATRGAMYEWIFSEGWQYLRDTLLSTDLKEMVWFVAGDSNGSVTLKPYNSCGRLDSLVDTLIIYNFEVHASVNPHQVNFRTTGVNLNIDSVSSLTKDDYDYKWYPSSRVVKDDHTSGAVYWRTSTLVNPVETFWVLATEKVGSPACIAWDTVQIFVDSTFSLEANTKEFVCNTDMAYLFAKGKGGDSATYRYEWYQIENGEYKPLEEPNFSSPNPVIMSLQPEMSFRVIAYDSIHVVELDTTFYVIQTDTQYLDVSAKDLKVSIDRPYNKEVKALIGDAFVFEGSVAEGTGAYLYYWSPSELMKDKDTSQLRNSSVDIFGDYRVIFTAKDTLSGCMQSDTIYLILSNDFAEVPNAFSPHTRDGINDVFMKGVDLLVMNRVGTEIYKTTNKEGWDGTYKGELVPKDDYFYVVTIISKQGKTYVKRGVVTVF